MIFDVTKIQNKLFYSSIQQTQTQSILQQLVKTIRLLRLLRVLKLFKNQFLNNQYVKGKVSNKSLQENQSESKITKVLKELNVKRLVILIILILITIPFFDQNLWQKQFQFQTQHSIPFLIPRFIEYPSQHQSFIGDLITNYSDQNFTLIVFKISGVFSYQL